MTDITIAEELNKKNGPASGEETFEERFARLTEENRAAKEEARKELLRAKTSGGRRADSNEIAIYKAKAAAVRYKEKSRVGEGAIRRTVRLVKGLKSVQRDIAGREFMCNEKARSMRSAVWKDAWAPVYNFLSDAVEDFWNFLSDTAKDFWDIILFIVDIFIWLGYWIGSVCLYIWDHIWDFRLWFDARKKSIFQIFAGVVTAAAMMLILINSMSAYEYSYYGRYLGTARSKQDVYKTIEILGEKLSEASGANIDLNVERDIEFTKIFGFGLKVDSADDILNTLTYMKDIHVEGFAVALDGENVVYVDTREKAENIIQQAKDYFTPQKSGVTYKSVTFGQSVTVEEAAIQLRDLWNEKTAVKYLVTGFVKDVMEGEEQPLIIVNSVENTTYEEEIEFGFRYQSNSSMYETEISLAKAGKPGINTVVAEVVRQNGEPVETKVISITKTSNPVDAVYYRGTKPVPDSKGTGTWLFPIKVAYKITSKFGYRNTNIKGASTQHKGIDIGVPKGTKVYAADGGVCIFSGWQSAQGYMVIIDHGGLYESKYEHCSKLLVSVGDKIFQGQNIALVGSTGVSSGAHLHFEVRYNGTPINPLSLTYQ